MDHGQSRAQTGFVLYCRPARTRFLDQEKERIISETILKNALNSDDHCGRHRAYRFHKNSGESRSIPNALFYYLDHCVRHPDRNNCVVLAAEQEEIASTYEHDRSKGSDEKVRGHYRGR